MTNTEQMDLSKYVCTKVDAMEGRRGIMWIADVKGPNGEHFVFEDRGDGSMITSESLTNHAGVLRELQRYGEELFGFEGLVNAVSCMEKGDTLEHGFKEWKATMEKFSLEKVKL